jgi:hypothetical protein
MTKKSKGSKTKKVSRSQEKSTAGRKGMRGENVQFLPRPVAGPVNQEEIRRALMVRFTKTLAYLAK